MPNDEQFSGNQHGRAESSRPATETRFALVLNGGVSLAVWMGGVTHELAGADAPVSALQVTARRRGGSCVMHSARGSWPG